MQKQHTSAEFEQELRQLKERLLAMAGRCERMISEAIGAFEAQDRERADTVVAMDREVNADELAVDELAVRILALRQPVGRDLRFLLTAVKVDTDLERIGDECVNVAERAREMADKDDLPGPHVDLVQMGERTSEMLRAALDSFVEEDADKARQIFDMDDAVDKLHGHCLLQSVAFIKEHPDRAHGSMRVASCAKYLERIGDHATNIAEMVVFLVRAEDVRHAGKL